jgi:hypothetical protein
MIVVCQQPNYFSWLGYFEQCARADRLIILDSVQWIRRGLQNRAKILPHIAESKKDKTEDFQWLTLPLLSQGHRSKTLRELKIAPHNRWATRHWNTLVTIYGKRPHFKTQMEPLLRPWFEQVSQTQSFLEVAVSSMQLCFKALDIHPEIFYSSQLPEQGAKSVRILSLCKAVDANIYYSGLASASYLDSNAFRYAGVQLVWQRWKHTQYEQGRSDFRSHLSILDALANIPLNEIKGWLEPKPWGPFGELWKDQILELE